MGRRDVRELNRRMRVLLAHLLKWQLQPKKRTASWRTTLSTQRFEIDALLRDSPSLRPRLLQDLPANYARAIKRADKFPSRCPFTLEQILDEDFLPA